MAGYSFDEIKDKTPRILYKGSGIGLYMTEQIVAKHNGILKVFNHENGGAVFKASFV
jgi:signal transduction histidine kinase